MSRIRNCRGLTLMELIVTIALVSGLLGAVWVLYQTGFCVFYDQELRAGLKGGSGRGVERLAGELRQAISVTTAQATNMSFSYDADDDGDDDAVQYAWSGAAGDALYRVADATAPLVDSVSSLAFSYYDGSNNLLSFPVTASQVRAVTVNVTVSGRDESFTLRLQTRLRNLS